ncbi:hypothetical protein D915_008761 [Fasciola hepatica]|uniref:poly(ADP-ribose) glycohydrolase n=1 Tax=Fasciola hepatica TaxID=6192 RepID=A0A4E0RTR8_FASHE|nr:hypothetical protein D915_008761 [Fasciola hepatica]
MTFVGLGNFIDCLEPEERNWLRNVLFPFVFRCAMDIEQYNTETLPYCVREQGMLRLTRRILLEYSVSIPFNLAVSVVACSFMCLIPAHPSWNLLMNEANFTYFFASITDASCPQAEKLRSLFDYFEHCRHFGWSRFELSSGALRITRRVLTVTPPPFLPLSSLGNIQPRMDSGKRELIRVLGPIPLPYVLVDAYNSIESVADRLRIPMTHFVNAYVGGNVLRSDGPTDDSLFFRYPDLLTCLPLCHRLEDAEALWIDHFRGPFVPSKNFPPNYVATDPEQLKWRRLVCMNSSCFPNWASELQYSDACLISEISKACAAFFGVSQSTMMAASPTPPFSSSWWEFHLNNNDSSKNKKECPQFLVPQFWNLVRPPSYGTRLVLTSRVHCLLDIAEPLTESIVLDASNRALERRHGFSSYIHAPADLLGHRSTVSCLNTRPRANHTKERSLSFQAQQIFPGSAQSMAGHCHSPHHELPSEDTYVERFPVDLCNTSRASFSGSVGSGSGSSYCLSSSRSSFSRGSNLSTQSSLRRLSEFSSSGSNFLPLSRIMDGSSSELHGLVEHEAEGLYSARDSSPCPDTAAEMVLSHRPSTMSTALVKLNGTLVLSEAANRLPANSEVTKLKIFGKLVTPNSSDQSGNLEQSQRTTEVLLGPLVDKLIDQTYSEARNIALARSVRLRHVATLLSKTVVADSIKAIAWFQNWSQRILCEASKRAVQLYKSAAVGESTGQCSLLSISSRRMERAVKRGFRVRDTVRPRWLHSVLSRGSRSSEGSARYSVHIPLDFGGGNSSGSSSAPIQQRGYFRLCSHPLTRRQHFRLSGRLIPSEKPKPQINSPSDLSAAYFPSPNKNQIKGGYPAGWRFRFSPIHRSTLDFVSHRPTTTSIAPRNKALTPVIKERSLPFSRASVHLYVQNQLHRFAGSVASECCARAFQQVRMLQSGSRVSDRTRLRPPGVVTSSWNKNTINPTADPQVKIMTQWIAAAAVSSSPARTSIPTTRGPKSVRAQTAEKSVSVSEVDSAPFTEYRISPLIVCTNNDPRLKELENILGMIYAAECSAGALLSLLMDYGAYRLTASASSSTPECPRSTGSIHVRSLFDFLYARLTQAPAAPTVSRC